MKTAKRSEMRIEALLPNLFGPARSETTRARALTPEQKAKMERQARVAEDLERQLNQTPEERQAEVRQDIAIMLDCLDMEFEGEGDSDPWDRVKRLVRIREAVKDVLETTLVVNLDLMPVEAGRFIEDHLCEMRND